MQMSEIITTDFLIVGAGVAGLRAAVDLSAHGDVLVVTKDILRESSTEYAQGGVAVALSDDDRVGIHYNDTIRAGDGLCRKDAVKVLVKEGPGRILELIEWGAEFDRAGTKLDFTIEGAHSKRRILHAHGDSTGKEIETVLINKVVSLERVKRIQYTTVIDLIVRDGVCHGVYLLQNGKVHVVLARATLLATGGGGQVFSRTTNPLVSTADGMAIALRGGAVLEDMEFVQFHPTALFAPGAPQFLLSEALRGEGGILRNIYGETFMEKYHPDRELAPRDVVARAIISEMVITDSTHIHLDLSHLDSLNLRKRFPRIYRTCLQYDIDITKDRIPVSPAAHYFMGGIKTDNRGRTNIAGLYAAGEAACTGIHGANRLASNSLLEGLVFGAITAASVAETALSDFPLQGDFVEDKDFGSISEYEKTRTEIRRAMWERTGIIRCAESLGLAGDLFSRYSSILNNNYNTREELELKNMLQTAVVITEAALRRECSVGAHYRSDFKDGKNCYYHTLQRIDEDGNLITIDERVAEDATPVMD